MQGVDEYNLTLEKYAQELICNNEDLSFLDGYYNYMLISASYSTAYKYLSYVISFLRKSKVSDVKDINLNTYTKYMASIRNKSSSYRIAIYHSLKKFSKYLKATNMADDYMQYVSRPKFVEKQATKDKREKGYLEKDEIKILIDGVYNKESKRKRNRGWDQRDETIIHLLLNTGIRRSALYKLDISDLDLNEKTIRVLEKGDKARVIYINDVTIEKLKEWLEFRSNALINHNVHEEALFINKNRTRMSQCGIERAIKRAGHAISIDKHISPHKLRATFGTQLYNTTNDVYFVQQCMGHTNPKTTELYIRGKNGTMSKKASDIMGNFIDNS